MPAPGGSFFRLRQPPLCCAARRRGRIMCRAAAAARESRQGYQPRGCLAAREMRTPRACNSAGSAKASRAIPPTSPVDGLDLRARPWRRAGARRRSAAAKPRAGHQRVEVVATATARATYASTSLEYPVVQPDSMQDGGAEPSDRRPSGERQRARPATTPRSSWCRRCVETDRARCRCRHRLPKCAAEAT